jgi:integrase
MIQSPRDLSEADSLGVLAADALNDVRRDRGAAAQSRDSGARFARLLGALGEVALEVGDRDQAPAPLSPDGCDHEQFLARTPNELGLVFPTPGGTVWRKDNFMARVFRPAVRRAGLAPLRFHDLRHTYAALMIAAGAHPKLLQAQLGHTSINVTLNTYGHLPDAFADAGEALDRLVHGERAESTGG